MTFLLPVVGIGGACFLPPMDEFAALDRVGRAVNLSQVEGARYWSHLTPLDEPSNVRGVAANPFPKSSPYERSGPADLRYWKLALDESQAKLFQKQFLSSRRGWSSSSIGYGTVPQANAERTRYSRASYFNNLTGDQLEWTEETRGAGSAKGSTFHVVVGRSTAQKPWGIKLLRWVGLVISG